MGQRPKSARRTSKYWHFLFRCQTRQHSVRQLIRRKPTDRCHRQVPGIQGPPNAECRLEVFRWLLLPRARLKTVLQNLVVTAQLTPQSQYREYNRCGKTNPPEWTHNGKICQSRAERYRGVVPTMERCRGHPTIDILISDRIKRYMAIRLV